MNINRPDTVEVPLREDQAAETLASIEDPIVMNVVKILVASARMRFMRLDGMTSEEWQARLPCAGFDMEFFVCVVRDALKNRELIEKILSGETIESASGWDV